MGTGTGGLQGHFAVWIGIRASRACGRCSTGGLGGRDRCDRTILDRLFTTHNIAAVMHLSAYIAVGSIKSCRHKSSLCKPGDTLLDFSLIHMALPPLFTHY